MRKILFSILLIALFAACGEKNTITQLDITGEIEFKDSLLFPTTTPSTPKEELLGKVKINMVYPNITKIKSGSVKDSLSADFSELLFKSQWTDSSINKTAEEFAKEFYNEYKKLQNDFPGYSHEWYYDKELKIIYNSPKIVSFRYSDNWYTGGAHPNYTTILKSRDSQTGQTILLKNILKDNSLPQLVRIAEKIFRKEKNLTSEMDLGKAGFWFEDGKFILNSNFAITEKGLLFYYNDYEIACHAMGPTELLIPNSEIKDLLR